MLKKKQKNKLIFRLIFYMELLESVLSSMQLFIGSAKINFE